MTAGWNSPRGAALHAGPNMTPLVDVVMVILIFLMLAGSFGGVERYLAHTLTVRRDGSSVKPATLTPPPVEITVTVDAAPNAPFAASVNGRRVHSAAELTASLTVLHDQLEHGGASDALVRLSAGRGAGYRHVLAAYESAAAARFGKVALISATR